MIDRRVNTFICAVESGSFSAAAEKLYTTPASVMNQVNGLESALGFPLVKRTSRGIVCTDAGKCFYEDAKKLAADAEAAIGKAKAIAGTRRYTVRVGTSLLNSCKPLIDLWSRIGDGDNDFQIKIIPFEDDRAGILTTLSSLGKQFDFLVGPCGSEEYKKRCNLLLLGEYDVCIAVPRSHLLAKKKKATVSDLHGETVMMCKRGDAPVLDKVRDMFESEHPEVHIEDLPHFYDAEVFNACEQMGNILLTLSVWEDIHPSLVTIPVDWNYKVPYGLMYAKAPTPEAAAFLHYIMHNTERVNNCST